MKFKFCHDYEFFHKDFINTSEFRETIKEIKQKALIIEEFEKIKPLMEKSEFLEFLVLKNSESNKNSVEKLIDQCREISKVSGNDPIENLVNQFKSFVVDYEKTKADVEIMNLKKHAEEVEIIYKKIREYLLLGNEIYCDDPCHEKCTNNEWHSVVKISNDLLERNPEEATLETCQKYLEIISDIVKQGQNVSARSSRSHSPSISKKNISETSQDKLTVNNSFNENSFNQKNEEYIRKLSVESPISKESSSLVPKFETPVVLKFENTKEAKSETHNKFNDINTKKITSNNSIETSFCQIKSSNNIMPVVDSDLPTEIPIDTFGKDNKRNESFNIDFANKLTENLEKNDINKTKESPICVLKNEKSITEENKNIFTILENPKSEKSGSGILEFNIPEIYSAISEKSVFVNDEQKNFNTLQIHSGIKKDSSDDLKLIPKNDSTKGILTDDKFLETKDTEKNINSDKYMNEIQNNKIAFSVDSNSNILLSHSLESEIKAKICEDKNTCQNIKAIESVHDIKNNNILITHIESTTPIFKNKKSEKSNIDFQISDSTPQEVPYVPLNQIQKSSETICSDSVIVNTQDYNCMDIDDVNSIQDNISDSWSPTTLSTSNQDLKKDFQFVNSIGGQDVDVLKPQFFSNIEKTISNYIFTPENVQQNASSNINFQNYPLSSQNLYTKPFFENISDKPISLPPISVAENSQKNQITHLCLSQPESNKSTLNIQNTWNNIPNQSISSFSSQNNNGINNQNFQTPFLSQSSVSTNKSSLSSFQTNNNVQQNFVSPQSTQKVNTSINFPNQNTPIGGIQKLNPQSIQANNSFQSLGGLNSLSLNEPLSLNANKQILTYSSQLTQSSVYSPSQLPSPGGLFGNFNNTSFKPNNSQFTSSAFPVQQNTSFGSFQSSPSINPSPSLNQSQSNLFTIPKNFGAIKGFNSQTSSPLSQSSSLSSQKNQIFNPMPTNFGSFSATSNNSQNSSGKSIGQSPFASLIAQNKQNPQQGSYNANNFVFSKGASLDISAIKLNYSHNIFQNIEDTLYENISKEVKFSKLVIQRNQEKIKLLKSSKNSSLFCQKVNNHLTLILQSVRGVCWFYEASPRLAHFIKAEKYTMNDNSKVGILEYEPLMQFYFYSLIKHFVLDFAIPAQDISKQEEYCYNLACFNLLLFFYITQKYPSIMVLLWAYMVERFPILIGDYGSYRFDGNISQSFYYLLHRGVKERINEQLLGHMMHFKVSCLLYSFILRLSCHNFWHYVCVSEDVINCWGSSRIWIVISRILNQNFPIHYINVEFLCNVLIFCSEPMTIFYKLYFVKMHSYIVVVYFQNVLKIETDDTFINNAKNCIKNYFDSTLLKKKRKRFHDFCMQCQLYFSII